MNITRGRDNIMKLQIHRGKRIPQEKVKQIEKGNLEIGERSASWEICQRIGGGGTSRTLNKSREGAQFFKNKILIF